MAGKVHPVRLGVFIYIGMSLVILAIFLIGNRESMFSKTFNVKAYFNNNLKSTYLSLLLYFR